MKKKVVSVLMSLTLAAGCFAGVPAVNVSAEEAGEDQTAGAGAYKYVYAALDWDEYWKSEGVYLSGDNWTAASSEEDGKGETDKGAFDTVTRATTNHGLHRGSYQCSAVIYDTDGNSYEVSHWSDDGKTIYLTNGETVGWAKGTITKADSTTAEMASYEVSGIKYVPVAVEEDDYAAFCEAYGVVENGEKLNGGFGENNLKAYELTADVTADTNGLKTAVKNDDGSFSFEARKTGTDSGVEGESLAAADDITVTVLKNDKVGSYGEFIRVDLTGGGYGVLGAKMQAAKWTYYGDDSTRTNALVTYGTKFAADNWMHKANGIQLGLTDSLRCQLPEGYDGTGYWTVTVYALGYEDYTFDAEIAADNIGNPDGAEADKTELQQAVNDAKALKESDYCADSWAAMQTELEEAEAELASTHAQVMINEAVSHLKAAMEALEEHTYGAEYVKTAATATAEGQKAKKCTKCGAEVLTGKIAKVKAAQKVTLKKTTAKLSKVKKSSMKVSWKKVSNAAGYQIQYSTSSKFKKAKTVKVSSKKSSATIKKLKKNKKYYVRVRSYNKTSGKTVYSDWSAKVSKKTKKK